MFRPAPIWRAVTLAAVALGLAVPLQGCGNDDDRPLVVTPVRHDFGEVLHGIHVRKSFTIKNQADKAVTITMAEPNCACFRVIRKPRPRLDPGEETEFVVVLESDVIPPQRIRGKFLEVRTDNVDAPTTRVPLEGTIFSPLYSKPKDRLSFGMLTGRPEVHEPRTIKIRAEREYTVELDRNREGFPGGFRVSRPDLFEIETVEREDGLDVIVRLIEDVGGAPGPFEASLNVAVKVKGPRMDPTDTFRGFRLIGRFPSRPAPAVDTNESKGTDN